MRRRLAGLTFGVMIGFGQATSASAHANILRSDPPAGATVESAPETLVIVFSEAVDPDFTRAQVVNSRGRTVNPGPGEVDPETPSVLSLPLAGLPRDSYTIVWRARSDVDGHVTSGSVPFGIGTAPDPGGLLPPLGSPDGLTARPSALDAGLRWLGLLAVAVALGGIPFSLLVWQPAVDRARRRKQDVAAADLAMTRLLRRLILSGCTCLAAVQMGMLALQVGNAVGWPPAAGLASTLAVLLKGRSGLLWMIRIGLIAGLAAWAWSLPRGSDRRPASWRLALALVGAIVLTISLGGHSAALGAGEGWAIAQDWLHGTAMVVWLGGLPPLWAAIARSRRQPAPSVSLPELLSGYSDMAVVCVAVLLWTGISSYRHHIDRLDLLAATTYGRALALKLVLFGLLLLVGAANFWWLSKPRDPSTSARLARRFRGTVAAELVFGAALLAAVGVMTSVAPSKAAWESQARAGVVQHAATAGVDMVLRVAPGLVGSNALALDIADSRALPGATPAPLTVLLRLSPPGTVGVPLQVEARLDAEARQGRSTAATPGDSLRRYTAHGNYFSRLGAWQVEAILRRRGFDDVHQAFDLRIVRQPEERLLTGPTSGGGRPSAGDPDSVARGAALFKTHCQSCHGPSGRGNGPDAAQMDPPPADLRVHVPAHEPAELFQFIAEGVPGTAMARFDATLSSDEIWHLVNYLEATFGPP